LNPLGKKTYKRKTVTKPAKGIREKEGRRDDTTTRQMEKFEIQQSFEITNKNNGG